jgi:anti-anti-sigma factor
VPEPHADLAVSPGQLTIIRQTEGDSVTLVIGGEIDLQSAPALERELADAERSGCGRVVLDLAALDFLDSTGMHLLVEAQHRAKTSGHELVLTHVPAQAERLLRLTGLRSRLTVE